MTFAEFAKDHTRHPHCASCANCLVDPNIRMAIVWCIGCRDRIKAALPKGARLPWGLEF